MNVPLATVPALLPNIGLGYQYIENVAQSWYHALNVRAEARWGTNLTFSAAYTWSKALDMASAEQQLPGIASDLGLGKSYSDYDHPQRFVASWVNDLPFERWTRKRWLQAIAGRWESSGAATFEAGPPYSVTMGVDTAFTCAAAPVYSNVTGPLVYSKLVW